MLKIDAKIRFTVEGKTYKAHDRFDMAFRFAEGLLFSGRIKSSGTEYLCNKEYDVEIDFFTIDTQEAYKMVEHTLQKDARFVVCIGKKIVGDAKMVNFSYE